MRGRSRILHGFGGEKARFDAPFGDGFRSLCRNAERLHVPELGQKRVLIVVANARHNPPLFIELTNFAEWQRHAASTGLEGTERTIVLTLYGEPCDDNVSGVNVLRLGDPAIGECLGPTLCPLSELVRAVQCKSASIVSVDQALDDVAGKACEIAFVPALVRGTKGVYVL